MAVNLSLIGGAGWQFFDDNGAPLAGGKIYTYAAGTTTPLVTYTSRNGLTPNTNPIILDAAGRTPQQIWSLEGLLYKYVIENANNVLVRTWDEIGGSVVASNLAQDLANTTDDAKGDALIGFRQSNASGFLTGAVARTVNNKFQETVSVKDFGALGNGVADDTNAIQNAVASCPSGAVLLFPAGTYVVTAPILFAGKSNLSLFGYGTTIQCGLTRIQSYFNLDGASQVDVLGFTFDAKMQSMPLYTPADYDNIYNCGVYVSSSASDITVCDCAFINLYTVGGFFKAASNVIVTDCRFKSPLQSQTQMLQHLQFQTSSGIKVTDCDFDNAPNTSPATNACGIFASGITNYITIDNCTFNYCGRDNTGSHRLGVIDFYYDVDNVTVTNCVSKNTMAEFMRFSTCNNGLVTNNQIEINANCEPGSNTLALQSGPAFVPTANTKCRNIIISNNLFVNDTNANIATCLGVFSYDWGAWSENVIIEANVLVNFARMITILGPFDGIKIANNQSISTLASPCGTISAEHMPGITSNYGIEANSFFNNLDIVNNTISSRGQNGTISINYSSLTTTAYMGEFNISNNVVDATLLLSSGIAIAVTLPSTTPANTTLKVANNFTQRYNYAFQITNSGNVVLANNKSQKNTNYLIQSGNLSFNAYGNITRNGLLFGRAKLVAGAVTVLGSDCNTGDNIIVSHYDNSGVTLGALYLVNVGNGTFDIRSTSATDDANVVWQIIH